jgi:hypothetical protein
VAGEAVWSSAGSDATARVVGLGDFRALSIMVFEDQDTGVEGGTISVGMQYVPGQPWPEPGAAGSYRCSVTFVPIGGGTAYRSSQVEDDEPAAITTLNIASWDGGFLEGSVTGGAVRTDENGEVVGQVTIDLRFKAGVWDGFEYPCADE